MAKMMPDAQHYCTRTLVEYLALELEKVLPHGAVEEERLQLQPPGGQRGQRLLADTTHISWIRIISIPDPGSECFPSRIPDPIQRS
jgi:hypothetical protein